MGSTVRNGFSTLNRLLGKKNKDGSLSKSTTNLSALDTASQHNKIIPLAASNNAPFEQTFRITISLPRDQLFVVRVGAKTKLSQLLDTVCASKQLDASKFEFRHPDGTQTYDLSMTIGEVGLNEIRLADKTDKTYIKFNTEDIMKLRHLSRESLTSSSDFSKGSARQYSKTVSPYSSTNSLNSMDSATGLNQRNHNNNVHQQQQQQRSSTHLLPPVAPQRKKRVAPRPPSIVMDAVNGNADDGLFKKPAAVPRRAFHASTPNLNGVQQQQQNGYKLSLSSAAATDEGIEDDAVVKLRNGHGSNAELNRSTVSGADTNQGFNRQTIAGSTPHLNQRSRTSSDCSERGDGDVPTPRKRTFISAAKKKAAPAPPPRLTINVEATKTIIEELVSAPIVTTPPSPQQNTGNISKVMLNVEQTPSIAVSDATTTANVIEIDSRDLPSLGSTTLESQTGAISLGSSTVDAVSSSDEDETKIYNIQTGKPIISTVQSPPQSPSPTEDRNSAPHSHPIQPIEVDTAPAMSDATPAVQHKSLTILRESSEPSTPRAESPLWTYPLPAPQNFADTATSSSVTTSSRASSAAADAPIKPTITERVPLDFQALDSERASTVGDDVADHAVITSDGEDGYQGYSQKFSREALLESLERRREMFIEKEFQFLGNEDGDSLRTIESVSERATPVPVVQRQATVLEELKNVLQNDRVDTLLVGAVAEPIAGYDPTALSNFSIQTYATNGQRVEGKSSSTADDSSDSSTSKSTANSTHFTPTKRPSLTNGFPRVNRSDSFHSTRPIFAANTTTTSSSTTSTSPIAAPAPLNGLTPRSSSYISLIGTQKFENRSSFRSQHFDATAAYRRSSSSELSIADAPSLSSLSVMRSILSSNSRKNSVSTDAPQVAVAEEVASKPAPIEAVEPVRRSESATPAAAKSNVTYTQLNGATSPVVVAAAEVVKVAASAPVESAEKKWRYQGPPAISMSTWGERPKTSISIKTDTDYKSGAAASQQQQQQVSNSSPAAAVIVAASPAPTQPQPSPQATSVTVIKPAAETPSVATTPAVSLSPSRPATTIDTDRVPIIRGLVPKVSSTFIGGAAATTTAADVNGNLNIRRPSYEISTYVAEKPQSVDTNNTTTMTLGRVSIPNRWSHSHVSHNVHTNQSDSLAANPPAVTVKTFKVADPVSTTAAMMMCKTNYAIAKDGSFDSGYKSMPPVYSEFNAKLSAAARAQEDEVQQAAPFSQFTLRKTGLKDKILADSTARNITAMPTAAVVANNNGNSGAGTTVVHLRAADGSAARRPFSVPAFVVNSSGSGSSNTSPSSPSNNGVVAVTAAAIPAAPPTAPAPPPAAPAMSATLLRSAAQRKTLPPPEAEPRDQLLDAIRNFSKNQLKKK